MPTKDLDAVTGRKDFVASFYSALLVIWGKHDERAFKFNWTLYHSDDGLWENLNRPEPPLPLMRSEVLDRFLAGVGNEVPQP